MRPFGARVKQSGKLLRRLGSVHDPNRVSVGYINFLSVNGESRGRVKAMGQSLFEFILTVLIAVT